MTTNRLKSEYTLTVPSNDYSVIDRLVATVDGLLGNHSGSGIDADSRGFVQFRTPDDASALAVATACVGDDRAMLATGMGVNRRLVGGVQL